MHYRILSLLLFLLLVSSEPGFAQTATVEVAPKGPQSITRTIITAQNGDVYIASWEGVFRYDGSQFVNITAEESASRFFAVMQARNGDLWFGTVGEGVYRYDGHTFEHFTTADGLAGDRVIHIYEDQQGLIWFSAKEGLSSYDGNSFRTYTATEGLADQDINVVQQDASGRYWVGTRGETYTYDGHRFLAFKTPLGNSITNLRTVIEDQNGTIWLGGQDGLWRYDGNELIRCYAPMVGYLYEDSSGNLWFSAERTGGKGWALYRYDAAQLAQAPVLPPAEMPISSEMLFGIARDRAGGVWVGSLKGLLRYMP